MGPLNFSWTQGVSSGRQMPGVRREGERDQRERASRRQRLGPRLGAGAGASRVFVPTRASRVCESLWIWVRGRASACAFVCPWLRVAVSRLCPRFVGPLGCGCWWAHGCVRVRGLCLSTCRDWASVECVRAESRTPPQLLATLLSTKAPDLASNFSPGFSGGSPGPPCCSLGRGRWQPYPLSSPGVLRAGRGRDRTGEGRGWGSAVPGEWPHSGREERAGHPGRTSQGERGKRLVLGPGQELEKRSRQPVLPVWRFSECV